MFIRKTTLALSFVMFLLGGCADDGPAMWCSEGECWCDNSERFIDESYLCDGDNDCRDWQDERGCPGVRIAKLPCIGLDCSCDDGEIIPSSWLCDDDPDCSGGEDELGCTVGESSSSSSGGSSSSDTGNEACWDCDINGCTLYYAPVCY